MLTTTTIQYTLTTCMDTLWLAVSSANNNQSWEKEREPGCHWWETKKEGKNCTVHKLSPPPPTICTPWLAQRKTVGISCSKHTLLPIHFSTKLNSQFWCWSSRKNVQGGHLFMTLQSMINFKLSQQRFWHYHANTLAKIILKKSLRLNLSFKLNSLCKACH